MAESSSPTSKGNSENTVTPLRPEENVTSRAKKRIALSSPECSTLTKTDVQGIVEEVIKTAISDMLAKLNANMNSELKTIREELRVVTESISFMNIQYETAISEAKKYAQTAKDLAAKNEQMSNTIVKLTNRINQMEQHARSSNIEIQCVPENKAENVIGLTKQLGAVIGCTVADNDILSCTRIAKVNRDSPRPRSIIIQFSTPRLRDQFLAAAINFNKKNKDKLNSSHIGLAGPVQPIYVMEHLSATNKEIHAAARTKAKEIGFQFVWVRGGRILMRKDVTSEYIVIKDLKMLDNLK
ncbi:hypothetical protein PYW08_006118 [Mythimna loreyi]|uniref:Uncharacterized protein n=1 Tax=Mythimna loreyi TaxID=667449 RepID=A0ACC2QMB1_9NEOP|nr:hypothetical protein PYW08_006118 [Mythimna loreyi]